MSLGKSEEWFWNTELRIVWNLIEKHKELEKIRQQNLSLYIACSVWGKNPAALDKKEDTEIAGRDKPIDPALLRGLMNG